MFDWTRLLITVNHEVRGRVDVRHHIVCEPVVKVVPIVITIRRKATMSDNTTPQQFAITLDDLSFFTLDFSTLGKDAEGNPTGGAFVVVAADPTALIVQQVSPTFFNVLTADDAGHLGDSTLALTGPGLDVVLTATVVASAAIHGFPLIGTPQLKSSLTPVPPSDGGAPVDIGSTPTDGSAPVPADGESPSP